MSSWSLMQNQGESELIDSLGSDLSAIIHCPVRYCEAHYHKKVFECRCQKIFPVFVVQGAQESGDWLPIMEYHKNG